MACPTVGIVANPLSGRDIRRLVARASVFPNAEKANMVQRILAALHAVGVRRALVSTDQGGISAAVRRALEAPAGRRSWPEVQFLDQDPLTGSAADTINAVGRMVRQHAAVIVCLGGDGTARAAAGVCGDTPLLALSTGTNNVFPQMCEATLAGLAAGLLTTGAVDVAVGTYRACVLEVTADDRTEEALVDVCVTDSDHIGSRALWDPAQLRELYCTFAEPHAIGLSAVAGLLRPTPRGAKQGVALELGDPAASARAVLAPIAPGLVIEVGVRAWRTLDIDEKVECQTRRGVIALDGERELEFQMTTPVVCLRDTGPRCVDVPAVLAAAARTGALCRTNNSRPKEAAR